MRDARLPFATKHEMMTGTQGTICLRLPMITMNCQVDQAPNWAPPGDFPDSFEKGFRPLHREPRCCDNRRMQHNPEMPTARLHIVTLLSFGMGKKNETQR